MAILTIVVPVFNVEKYVARCLESVFSQNVDKALFNVIVVNDGSQDNSLRICENFTSKYSNLKIITQKNRGLSAARNVGLIHSSDCYVWFVDSDDYIEDRSLIKLLEHLKESSIDILTFNYLQPYEKRNKIDLIETYSDVKIFTKNEDFFNSNFTTTPWSKIYKTEFLKENNLKFFEGIIYEDQEFTPRAFFLATKIKCIPLFVYNHYHRDNSITTQSRNDRSINFIKVIDSLYEFKNLNVRNNPVIITWFENKISFLFSQALKFNDHKKLIQILKTKPYYPLKINKNLTKKDLIKYLLINFNLRIYAQLIRILDNIIYFKKRILTKY